MGKNKEKVKEGVDIPKELNDYLESKEDVEGPQAFAHYNRDAYIFELSEELKSNYTESELQAIIDDFRLQDVDQDQQEDLYDAGSLYCSIRAFDNALLLHFIADERQGTVVSLPPEAAPRLTELINDILEILAEHSGQDVDSLPSWTTQ